MKIKDDGKMTIEVVNICDFSQNLDYNIQTAKERIDYINKMMYTDEGYPVEFFEKLFDQDERLEMSKRMPKKDERVQKYVNLFPNSKDDKYEDTYEAKQMERIANYILQATDQPRMDKQQEYNFYDEEEFNKVIKKEYKQFREIGESGVARERYNKQSVQKLSYIEDDKKMAYLKRMGENSKCDGRQKMYKKDYKDKKLKDYILPLEEMRNRLSLELQMLEKMDKIDPKTKYQHKVRMTNLLQHQEDYKTAIKGMIEFTDPLPDTTKTDYNQFDIEDFSQIMEMIYIGERHEADSDLGCMTIDFEYIIQKILNDERYPKLSDKEAFVLKYIRKDREVTQEEMANFIEEDFGEKCTQQEISRMYSQICKKISEAHYKQLKDFLVEFRWDGVKKCSRCGEWKLVEDYSKHAQTKDKLRPNCKQCDNI